MAMSQWISLCEAAGFDINRYELIDVYLLAGKIIHAGGNDEILKAMSPAERPGFREKVTGVVQLRH